MIRLYFRNVNSYKQHRNLREFFSSFLEHGFRLLFETLNLGKDCFFFFLQKLGKIVAKTFLKKLWENIFVGSRLRFSLGNKPTRSLFDLTNVVMIFYLTQNYKRVAFLFLLLRL